MALAEVLAQILDGDADFGGVCQRGGVHGPDVCLLSVVLEDVHQFAAFQAVAYVPIGAQQDASSINRPLVDDFAVVGRQGAGHFDAFFAFRSLQAPRAEGVVAFFDDQAFMAREFGQGARFSVALQVVGAGAQDAGVGGQQFCCLLYTSPSPRDYA